MNFTMDHSGPGTDVAGAAIAFVSANPAGVGAPFLAAFVGTFFMGVLFMQGTTYITTSRKDSAWLKLVVFGSLILSVLHVTLLTYNAWASFTFDQENRVGAATIGGVTISEPLLCQLTVSFAQSYFIYRSFILTERYRPLLIFLIGGLLCGLGLGLGLSMILITHPDSHELHKVMVMSLFAVTFVTDVVITGVTTWMLLSSRRGVNRRTDSGLETLLRVTWEAASPPTIMALLCIILTRILDYDHLFFAFINVIIPRLYVFSLMFTLNSRRAIRSVFEAAPANTNEPSPDRKAYKSSYPNTTPDIIFARMEPSREDPDVTPTTTANES